VSELDRARLSIVSTADVHPHEVADPTRERLLEQRLRDESTLRDPLIVGSVPDLAGYVLLDGTNRLKALGALGVSWALAQIVDYRDHHAVELRTWCHRASRPLTEIRQAAEAITGLSVASIPPLGVNDALHDHETLAVILDRNEQYALTRQADAASRANQLCRLVQQYEERMVRVDCSHEDLEEQAHSIAAGQESLIAFPPFSRSQVVMMATRETLIPAGITRHIIHAGRALRVNLPLSLLEMGDVDDANEALQSHLASLQPRFYREPTILFDS
jgi:hypothetical protein